MDLSRYQRLLLTLENRILTITLNRPEQLNATDETMHTEISNIFHEINGEPGIDVVILTGAGKAFSAGGGYDSMLLTIENPQRWDRMAIEAVLQDGPRNRTRRIEFDPQSRRQASLVDASM